MKTIKKNKQLQVHRLHREGTFLNPVRLKKQPVSDELLCRESVTQVGSQKPAGQQDSALTLCVCVFNAALRSKQLNSNSAAAWFCFVAVDLGLIREA